MRNRRHDIEKYLRGELSPAEMHALEKEALNDPFLAEALEGVEQAGADNFLYDLHKLNRSVHDRMRRKARKNNKVIRMWGWTSAVAATILLVAVSGFLVVNLLKEQHARQQTMREIAAPLTDSIAKNTDSLTVTPRSGPPLAALEQPGKAEGAKDRDAAPPEALKKDKTPPLAKPDDLATRPDEVLARRELTPAEEFVAEEKVSDKKEKDEEQAETNHLAQADELKTDPPVARQETTRERAVSDALEGRAAGLESKRRSQPATAAETSPRNLTVIRGRVITEDGQGLPGVNVLVEDSNSGAVTDGEGNFQLAVPSEGTKLQFAFIGFESKVVEVTNHQELTVTLNEDVTTLSEVVVTGYAGDSRSADPETFHFAEPNGGRSDFKNYLASAVKYPQRAIRNKVEGKVTVQFTVQPTGKLTDFEVIKGIGSGCEEELIRAIQQGPYWKPSTRGDQAIPDKVSVRFKFKLPE